VRTHSDRLGCKPGGEHSRQAGVLPVEVIGHRDCGIAQILCPASSCAKLLRTRCPVQLHPEPKSATRRNLAQFVVRMRLDHRSIIGPHVAMFDQVIVDGQQLRIWLRWRSLIRSS